MARLPDEQWDMIEDSIAKKNIGHSARNRRTHCGKGGSVKFPSDYMTKKELKSMNGEVKSYNMNSPMSWEQFKQLPDDLKVEYIRKIRNKFNVPDCILAEFMGVEKHTFSRWMRTLGLGLGKAASGEGKKFYGSDNERTFREWFGKTDENEPVEAPKTGVIDIHEVASMTDENGPSEDTTGSVEAIVPESGNMVFECEANSALRVIQSVLANRKVRLNIYWEIIKGEEE